MMFGRLFPGSRRRWISFCRRLFSFRLLLNKFNQMTYIIGKKKKKKKNEGTALFLSIDHKEERERERDFIACFLLFLFSSFLVFFSSFPCFVYSFLMDLSTCAFSIKVSFGGCNLASSHISLLQNCGKAKLNTEKTHNYR